jgi:hypothetical protein
MRTPEPDGERPVSAPPASQAPDGQQSPDPQLESGPDTTDMRELPSTIDLSAHLQQAPDKSDKRD